MMKWAAESSDPWGSKRDKQENHAVGWPLGLIVLAVIVLAINAWATSSGGYDDQEHRGPVPPGVQQIDANRYVAEKGNPVLMSQICWGDADTVSSTSTTEVYSKALGGKRLIACERGQKWNVIRKEKPSFLSAAYGTLFTPGWFVPFAIAIGLALLYPLLLTFGSWRAGAPGRKAARRAAKQKPLELEQGRRELVKSYALGEIDDLQFQTGMDKLYASGLKRAEE